MVNSEQLSFRKRHSICFAALVLVASIFALTPPNSSAQSGIVHQYPRAIHKGLATQIAPPPTTGSRIYWFSINTAGYGSAPISMISPSAAGAQIDSAGNAYVLTNSQGSFGITAFYACPSSTSYMYVLAVGGDAGTGVDNPYASNVAVIPTTCGISWSVDITETTTVAAAYALGTFATVATNSFATDSNSGTALRAAVAYSSSLINSANATIPSGGR